MSGLGSAPVPELSADDHIRGPADAMVLIEYADFECPFCAALEVKLADRPLRRVFRHFPVRSSHPRAWAAACAAEAAALQDAFWQMHDLLFARQARLEDPHLWEMADQLRLDLDRFENDRRSNEVQVRVRQDFESGVRAGVVTTPTVFVRGRKLTGRMALEELA